jgi:hypothetical protein
MASLNVTSPTDDINSLRRALIRIHRLPPTFLIGSIILIFYLIVALTGRLFGP